MLLFLLITSYNFFHIHIYVYIYIVEIIDIVHIVRFSCISILFIAIVLLLIEREPRKHINIDLIKAKLIFVLTHDVTVDFGKSF